MAPTIPVDEKETCGMIAGAELLKHRAYQWTQAEFQSMVEIMEGREVEVVAGAAEGSWRRAERSW